MKSPAPLLAALSASLLASSCIAIPKGYATQTPKAIATRKDASGKVIAQILRTQVDYKAVVLFSAEGPYPDYTYDRKSHDALQIGGAAPIKLAALEKPDYRGTDVSDLPGQSRWLSLGGGKGEVPEKYRYLSDYHRKDAINSGYEFKTRGVMTFNDAGQILFERTLLIRSDYWLEKGSNGFGHTRKEKERFNLDLPRHRIRYCDDTGWRTLDLVTGTETAG